MPRTRACGLTALSVRRSEKQTFGKRQASRRNAPDFSRRSRLWLPVLPFLLFWALAFVAYQFGPIINIDLSWQTYVYLLCAYGGVILGYRLALGRTRVLQATPGQEERKRARWLLEWTAPLSALGTAGLVLDRLLSGAGSVERTLFETQTVREVENQATTVLTTVSVAPYSFWLVTLACYFYCRVAGVRIGKVTASLVYLQLALVAFNAFLSANRGVYFWISTYWLFFILFLYPGGLKEFRRRATSREKIALCAFVALGVIYSAFIARRRNSEEYLQSLAQEARRSTRVELAAYEDEAVGTFTALLVYGTHQFSYIDAFVARAEPLAFRPEPLVGGRLLDQLRRFDNSLGRESEIVFTGWIRSAGLSEWGWASVWGYSLPMFGWLGSIAFFFALGHTFGLGVRRYIERAEIGLAVLLFSFYAALNMSFNWIGGDTTHNLGYVVGVLLLMTRKRGREVEPGLRWPQLEIGGGGLG